MANKDTPIIQVRKDNVGIGTTNPSEALHVVGNIIGGNNDTDATRKYARYGAYHFTNAEEPFYGLYVDSQETQNYLRIGGGTTAGNAATSIFFYTAADTTTTDGTLALTIDGSLNSTFAGNVILDNSSANGANLTLASSGNTAWELDNNSGTFRLFRTGGSSGIDINAAYAVTLAGTLNSGAITSTAGITGTTGTFSATVTAKGQYNVFGPAHASVSNDGNWAGRLNLAAAAHARLDVTCTDDSITTTMYSHTGHAAGKVGTVSNHKLIFMTAGGDTAELSTAGNLSTTGTVTGTNVDSTNKTSVDANDTYRGVGHVPLGGGTMTGPLNMHAGNYEGSITFGSNSTWRCGIRTKCY